MTDVLRYTNILKDLINLPGTNYTKFRNLSKNGDKKRVALASCNGTCGERTVYLCMLYEADTNDVTLDSTISRIISKDTTLADQLNPESDSINIELH